MFNLVFKYPQTLRHNYAFCGKKDKDTMNILYVIANLAPRYGGPPKACFEMARAMAKLGHNVSIYTTNQDGLIELKVPIGSPFHKEGVVIRYFPIQRPRFWGYSFPLARRRVRQALPC